LGEKQILILISSPPYRNLNPYEALRATLGLINHEVKIIWTQDGVYNALRSTKNIMNEPLIRLANDMDIIMQVFEKDLQKRNLMGKELLNNVIIISQEELIGEIFDSDIVITF
jgi:sulfur relay (sulfurtransferase) DsrF/TusC family protein